MRGFYIGRFQPYHNGHHKMVKAITAEVDELVLGIGSAGHSHTQQNPFTAGERVMMVTKSVADFDVTTYAVPIEDLDRNSVWVSHVQSMSPTFDVAYSNNPLVIQLFSEADVEVRQSPMFNREILKGSTLRERMIHDDDWKSLVPSQVIDVIEEIDGIERMRRLGATDTSTNHERISSTTENELSDDVKNHNKDIEENSDPSPNPNPGTTE
ncbi:nicotinamide-nucleotide adenylyltransferase [Haloquadratum walsbyi]|jgi:nicotinamide-nucleotide adenylyltransferase|uniref:Nicotinamide-nucleotide adenylyltransferase n=1 Tax=Haloquadratum walsbyi J07HQW2 TaxID=1238425 RepID=U1PRT3_9EURY|nr:nicotinamide-nucleotide adenylyltransferase [Haloquadratum walsbyi]ERG96472.1 MAG: nicotinamide-nucleotide adenylyltransferase [Haloquadratum walsbyi J07HQW2]